MDALWSAGTGAVALALFTATLLPGLGGPEDSPKFQYVGYVFGTPHPPGYPLYTILSGLFAQLPFGSVPYRANLFSAICAAVAVAAAWRLARALGSSRIAACGAALALACTASFWRYAVVAEVYALAAALTALTAWLTVRWSESRRFGDLCAAVACASAAAGNHLTIGAMVPALIAFVVLVDARAALRTRAIVANAALVLLGLSQYLYILVRTHQHALDLEATARTLGDLWGVMRAQRFSNQMFVFDLHGVIVERVPLVFGELKGELHGYGLVLVVAGLVLLFRRKPLVAGLLMGALGGLLALALEVNADVKGFLVPVVTLAWPLAAMPIDAIAGRIALVNRRVGAAALVALAAGPVAALCVSNFSGVDQHRNTYDAVFFTSLFSHLPQRTAFVAEEYVTDSMVHQSLITSGRARSVTHMAIPPEPDKVQPWLDDGFEVLAFTSGAAALARYGYQIEPTAPVLGGLAELLTHPDLTILAAVSGGPVPAVLRRFSPSTPIDAHAHTIVVVPGGGAAIESGIDETTRSLAAGSTLAGGSIPVDVTMAANGDRASIAIAGRPAAVATPGTALVVLDRFGQIVGTAEVPPGSPLVARVPTTHRPIFRVAGRRACTLVGDRGWHDVTPALAGGLAHVFVDDFAAGAGRIIVYATADTPLAPMARPLWSTPRPGIEQQAFDRLVEADRGRLATQLAEDGVGATSLDGGRYVERLSLSLEDRGEWAMAEIGMGGIVRQALARGDVDRVALPRAGVCRVDLPPVVDAWLPGRGDLWLGAASDGYFGPGWHPGERAAHSEDPPTRWTAAPDASLVLPLGRPTAMRLRIGATPAPGVSTMGISVNGVALAPTALVPGRREYDWIVQASAWHAGLNAIAIHTDRAVQVSGRRRGVEVSTLRLERLE